MKYNEKDIQRYIWENRSRFGKMIQDSLWPEDSKKKPQEYAPWELLYYHLMERYKWNVNRIKDMDMWGYEVSLLRENDNIIRADLLGGYEAANGLVICELKVSRTTERQAYTEMLAYANHIRREFAPMGRKDIVYLLIAPMEERIVRESTIHSLLYDLHNVVALVPHVGENIESLSFEVWIPPMKDFIIEAKTACQFTNIDTFKICWRGVGFWSPKEKDDEPTQEMIHRLNRVTTYAAQLMERDGINGFVYCSQSYPEIREAGFMENSITLCGINPYKAAKTKLLYETGADLKTAGTCDTQYLSLRNIIPSLRGDVVDNEEYWFYLAEGWASCLDDIGFEVQEFANLNKCGVWNDREKGTFSWYDYLYNSSEDHACWNYDVCLTGILREMYTLKIRKYYEMGDEYENEDKTDYVIDMLNSQYHVRTFLSELANELDAEEDLIDNPDTEKNVIFSDRVEDLNELPKAIFEI